MQERHLYEYATIRFVPKVEREEFINVLYCSPNDANTSNHFIR